jgi:hypothetical protein
MKECHELVAILAPHLIKNKNAFDNNDKKAIVNELNLVLKRIDSIVYAKYNYKNLVKIINDEHDFPLQNIFREFYTMTMLYLSDPRCINNNERIFANIFM